MSDMTRSARRTGTRLLAEGVVLVASILVAFALDAWWDARTARGDLELELRSVRQELLDNRAALAERVEGHRLAIANTDEILERIAARGPSGSITVADSLLYRAFVTSPTTDPSTGALDALISSGRIALLESIELRRFLAGFRNRVEDVREDELGAREVAHGRVFPLFQSDPSAERAAAAGRASYLTGALPDTWSVIEFDDEEWTRIRGALALRLFWLSSSVAEGEEFLDAMDAASDLMEDEIAGVSRDPR